MENNIKLPDKSFLRIEMIYAFVSSDNEGEGIIGMETPNGWMPFIGADLSRVKDLKKLADSAGLKYKIYKLTKRELWEIN